jgi:phosphoglycolate phosphatase-like HAD superfamily hydrolase
VLSDARVERFIGDVIAGMEAGMAGPAEAEVARLRAELEKLRGEQRKYAAAIAAAPDVPELLTELRRRGDRIKRLEIDLAVLDRAPAEKAATLAKLHDLPPEEQRPTGRGRPRKQVWAVSLTAHTAGPVSPTLVTPPWTSLVGTS